VPQERGVVAHLEAGEAQLALGILEARSTAQRVNATLSSLTRGMLIGALEMKH
jgi:hypothetical protein